MPLEPRAGRRVARDEDLRLGRLTADVPLAEALAPSPPKAGPRAAHRQAAAHPQRRVLRRHHGETTDTETKADITGTTTREPDESEDARDHFIAAPRLRRSRRASGPRGLRARGERALRSLVLNDRAAGGRSKDRPGLAVVFLIERRVPQERELFLPPCRRGLRGSGRAGSSRTTSSGGRSEADPFAGASLTEAFAARLRRAARARHAIGEHRRLGAELGDLGPERLELRARAVPSAAARREERDRREKERAERRKQGSLHRAADRTLRPGARPSDRRSPGQRPSRARFLCPRAPDFC
jgi:hypothetical protein